MNLTEATAALASLIEQRMELSDDPHTVTDKLRDLDREIDALQRKLEELEQAAATPSP